MPALRRHGLRNAAVPVVTVLGLQLATLLIGAVVVERVFVIPGLGSLLLDAVANRDLIIVQDVVMLLVVAVLVVNFVVDLLYLAIDPRLRGGAPMSAPEAGSSTPARSRSGARRGARRRRLQPQPRRRRACSCCARRRHGAGVVRLDAVRPDARRPRGAAADALGASTGSGTDKFGRDVLSQIIVGRADDAVRRLRRGRRRRR